MVEETMASLDKDPLWKWVSPMLLVGFPLIGVALNFLAITHIQFDGAKKELIATFKLRWLNIFLLLLSLLIVAVFFLYILTENLTHMIINKID